MFNIPYLTEPFNLHLIYLVSEIHILYNILQMPLIRKTTIFIFFKGTYQMYNWMPRSQNYPPAVPFKKLKVECIWLLHGKIIMIYAVHVTFDDDYKYRTQYQQHG